jgi:hypothetical protein
MPVIRPQSLGRLDIALLPSFSAASQQNHQRRPITSKIHAVSRSPIDPVFEHAFAHRFHVGDVALREPRQCDGYLCSRGYIQVGELRFERTPSVSG